MTQVVRFEGKQTKFEGARWKFVRNDRSFAKRISNKAKGVRQEHRPFQRNLKHSFSLLEDLPHLVKAICHAEERTEH